MLRQRLQQRQQKSRALFAGMREQQRCLVRTTRWKDFAPDRQESRRVVDLVLDFPKQDLQVIHEGRCVTCERCSPVLVAGTPGSLCIARNLDQLNFGQILRKPATALSE